MRATSELLREGLLLGAFFISGIATCEARTRGPATSHASYATVLTFKKGSSEISSTDRAELEAVFAQVKQRSQKVEQAHVAAWGDRPQDRSVSKARAEAVELLLTHMFSVTAIETYNMGERGNYFARALSGKMSAAELKTWFSKPGAPQTVTPEDFGIVKSKGGLMKAVVLIEIESSSAMSADNP